MRVTRVRARMEAISVPGSSILSSALFVREGLFSSNLLFSSVWGSVGIVIFFYECCEGLQRSWEDCFRILGMV